MKIQIKANAPVGFTPGSIIYTDFESGIGLVRSGFATLLDPNDQADPISVSIASGIELEFKNDSGNPLPVTGPVTDTQIRATALPVSLASVPSHPVTNAGTFAVQTTDVNGKPTSPPDYWDVSSATIVYQGWKSGATVILSKTDLSAGTRTWGVDSWANRVTATYA